METILQKVEPEQKEYGGFWIRFGAYLIDSIILGIPLSILSIIIFGVLLGTSDVFNVIISDPNSVDAEISDSEAIAFFGSYLTAMFLSIILNFVLAVAYFAGLHASSWQATIGKRMVGLKVTDLKGDRISFWRGLGRYASMAFLSSILSIGFIIAAFTEKKQALHDLISGTVVVRR